MIPATSGEGARDFGEGELDLALRSGRCPACEMVGDTERAILAWLAKANIRDRDTVGHLASAGGLCASHWAELLRRTDRRAMRALGRAMRQVADGSIAALDDPRAPIGPRCLVCSSMRRRLTGTIEMILRRLADPAARARLGSSYGLCQPHLAEALRLSRDERHGEALSTMQREQLRELAEAVDHAGDDEAAMRRALGALAEKLAGRPRAGTVPGSPIEGGSPTWKGGNA